MTPREPTAIRPPSGPVERCLVAAGVAGAVGFNLAYLAEGATRPGYDAVTLPVSALSLSSDGWMQVANFAGFGVLVIAFAVGLRRLLTPGPARTWAPLLEAVGGVALVAAGLFVEDPTGGYPLGVPAAAQASFHGEIHLAATIAAFGARLAWSLVIAARLARDPGWRILAGLAVAAAVLMVVCLAAFGGALAHGGPAGVFERLATVSASALTAAIALRLLWMPSTAVPAPAGDPAPRRSGAPLPGVSG